MPPTLALGLVLTAALLFVARAVLPGLPWKRHARVASRPDLLLLLVGALGLVLHCGAMFYRGFMMAIPGTDGYVQAVNDMGWVSVALYTVPALAVLVALRRQHALALALVALTLTTVGVTMYDGGPLGIHLATIAVATVALAATAAVLVRLPRRTRSRAGPRT